MRTILITAYAMNPYKGSEEGMGWNFTLQIARYQQVIVVTRVNNGPSIRQYMSGNPDKQDLFDRIRILYFDWPQWLRWWKKGPLLSMIYYYGWQASVAVWLLGKKLSFDVTHNLNFHNDWTPSFLWLLNKPMVWGPVGHHPYVPPAFIRPVYGNRAWLKDRLLWGLKRTFWFADPFLRLTGLKANVILCMNSAAAQWRGSTGKKCITLPSVATERVAGNATDVADRDRSFTVLSAGRLVPLKGFDLTIRAFSLFYHRLSPESRQHVQLKIIGSGPETTFIEKLIEQEGLARHIQLIGWIPLDKMQQMYRSADVYLFPSHEGAGMVVAEAMSNGLPVICLDNQGPGEFVHPKSSLKVTYSTYEKTVSELAEKLAELRSDPEYYRREQDLSLQRFHESFDWNIRGEQLKKIYESLCINNAS